jgi:hypothetical protein
MLITLFPRLFLLLSRNGKERRQKKERGNDDKENEHPTSPFSVVETNSQQIASFSPPAQRIFYVCVCVYI